MEPREPQPASPGLSPDIKHLLAANTHALLQAGVQYEYVRMLHQFAKDSENSDDPLDRRNAIRNHQAASAEAYFAIRRAGRFEDDAGRTHGSETWLVKVNPSTGVLLPESAVFVTHTDEQGHEVPHLDERTASDFTTEQKALILEQLQAQMTAGWEPLERPESFPNSPI